MSKKDSMTVEQYISEYWDFKGKRIQRKNRLNPNSIGRNHASIMSSNYTNHVKALLPKGLLLADITQSHVRAVLNSLSDSKTLANGTVAKIMVSFTTPLRDAFKEKLIQTDPTVNLESISTKGKERGVLTQGEFHSLVKWMGEHSDTHVLLAVVLAAATGMRQGEIRALKMNDIELINEEDALITIDEGYAVADGFKVPKGKKSRITPCPRKVAEALLDLGLKNTKGDALVFWSFDSKPGAPVSSSYLRDGYYKALDGIKIDETKRESRNISFHSLRHFFITRAGALLTGNKDSLRLSVGHESQSMTDRYTHADYESMKSVANAARLIIGDETIIQKTRFKVVKTYPSLDSKQT
jgi:integrase